MNSNYFIKILSFLRFFLFLPEINKKRFYFDFIFTFSLLTNSSSSFFRHLFLCRQNEVSNSGNPPPVHSCTATSTSASAVQVFQQSATTNPNLLSFPYQQSIASENGQFLYFHDFIHSHKKQFVFL